MNFFNGKIKVLMLKGEKGEKGDITYSLRKSNSQIILDGSDGSESPVDDIVSYAAQTMTTAKRLAALANCGLHIGSTPPENVTTAMVPIGELYAYFSE